MFREYLLHKIFRRDENGRKEQLSRIIDLASELRKVLVQNLFNHHPELRGVIENLASSVENLAELQKVKMKMLKIDYVTYLLK